MIIIADCHVDKTNEAQFRLLLDKLESANDTIVFLGDIFDLWIAVPRLETDLQNDFIDWCNRQPSEIGWIDGNHEFYVSKVHQNAFSWASETHYVKKNVFLCHGDLINTREYQYRIFRGVVKSRVMRWISRVVPIPSGIIQSIQNHTRNSNHHHKSKNLEGQFAKFTSTLPSQVNTVICGHFHAYSEKKYHEACNVILTPAWGDTEEVLVSNDDTTFRVVHWTDIPPAKTSVG